MTVNAFDVSLRRILAIPDSMAKNYSNVLMLTIVFVLILLSFSNNVRSLKKAANYGFLGIFLMLFFTFGMIIYNSYFSNLEHDIYTKYNYSSINSSFSNAFNQLAIIILSFHFHTYTFSIYECLDKQTNKKMMISCNIGIMISTLVYLIIGSSIYLTFGNYVVKEENMFLLLSTNKFGFLINMSFCVSVLMSFPISFFSIKGYLFYIIPYIRDYINNKVFKRIYQKNNNSSNIEKMKNLSNVHTENNDKKNINTLKKDLDTINESNEENKETFLISNEDRLKTPIINTYISNNANLSYNSEAAEKPNESISTKNKLSKESKIFKFGKSYLGKK